MLNRLFAIAAVLLATVFATLAQADTLRLSDGRTIEGSIRSELDGYIWFRHSVSGVEQVEVFGPDDIVEIIRDEDAAEPERGSDTPRGPDRADARVDRSNAPATPKRRVAGSNAPRAAVLSLGDVGGKDTIGIYVTAQKLRELVPMLEEEDIDIVVFRVNSGGGLTYSVPRINQVIQEEYKTRFRTVAWVESAISAAAMIVHGLEEHYFMPEGNYGACTAWRGEGDEVTGGQLEQYLFQMEQVSQQGQHDYRLMRSMQITEPLSADINEDNGTVEFRQDTEGELVLNREGEILTLTSQTAEQIFFSDGTASSIDELATELGLKEVDWVGEFDPTVPYPICEAEKELRRWRDRTHRDERKLNEYFLVFSQAVENIGGNREQSARFANAARQALTRIRGVVRNNPNFALLTLGIEDPADFDRWYREWDERIKEAFRPR